MKLHQIWLTDFRSHANLSLTFSEGLTAVIGPNGSGKTNLLEAIGVLSSLRSFRGVPNDRLLRREQSRAIVRAKGERDGRDVLIELELSSGRSSVFVNKQRLQRNRDLLGALRVTVFAPDDLSLIKDGPSVRREYLDDLLIALDTRNDAVIADYARVVKQRNTLLKQAKGRLDEAAELTLDVYDTQLSSLGERLTYLREHLLSALMPRVGSAYALLAGSECSVVASYRRSWETDTMEDAVQASRAIDLARSITSMGPHRDEVSLRINDYDSRTESSQGEQRTLALALRFAGHELVTEHVKEPPLLLLDDVLSELDHDRATALLSNLPTGQTLITSATELPASVHPDAIVRFPIVDLTVMETERDHRAEVVADG